MLLLRFLNCSLPFEDSGGSAELILEFLTGIAEILSCDARSMLHLTIAFLNGFVLEGDHSQEEIQTVGEDLRVDLIKLVFHKVQV